MEAVLILLGGMVIFAIVATIYVVKHDKGQKSVNQ
jgi:hypothetical protein